MLRLLTSFGISLSLFRLITTGPETKSLTSRAKSVEWFVAVKMHNQFDHWT
jgi:hypothetical protein